MKNYYDFTKGRKNSHALKIKKEGYSITEYYNPQDVTSGLIDDTKDIIQALVEIMSVNDSKRLLMYIKNNFDIPCPPEIWEGIGTDDSTLN